MNDAILHPYGARTGIRFERLRPQAPTAVWRAITDRAALQSWFPCDIVTDRREVGATLSFRFLQGEGPTLTGKVLAVEAPRILAYTWGENTLRFE